MMAFFLACAAAGFLVYGLLIILQRLSHVRPLSSLTGIIVFGLTLCLGWFMYIFIPLSIIALSNHESLDMVLLTQTIGPYFSLFLLLAYRLPIHWNPKGYGLTKTSRHPLNYLARRYRHWRLEYPPSNGYINLKVGNSACSAAT